MQPSHSRAPLDVPYAAPEDVRASAPAAAVETSYVCSVCASPWQHLAAYTLKDQLAAVDH